MIKRSLVFVFALVLAALSVGSVNAGVVRRGLPVASPCDLGLLNWHWSDDGCPDDPAVAPCFCVEGPKPTPRPWIGFRPPPEPYEILSYNLPVCSRDSLRVCGTWFRAIDPVKDVNESFGYPVAHAIAGSSLKSYIERAGKLPAEFFSIDAFLNNETGSVVWSRLQPVLSRYIEFMLRERKSGKVLPPPVVVTGEISVFGWALWQEFAGGFYEDAEGKKLKPPREMTDIFSQDQRELAYAILDYNKSIYRYFGQEFMVRIVIAPYIFGWANRNESWWSVIGSAEPWAPAPDGSGFIDRPTQEVVKRDLGYLDHFLYALKGTDDLVGQHPEIAGVIIQISNAYGYCGEGVEEIALGAVEALEKYNLPPEIQLETANWCEQKFKNVESAKPYADCRMLEALEEKKDVAGFPLAFVTVWKDPRFFSEDGKIARELASCPRDW